MESIFIKAEFRKFFSPEAKRSFSSLANYFGVKLQSIRVRSVVLQKVLKTAAQPPLDVHFKIYSYKKSPWQMLFRKSRAKREVRNLDFFASCGILVPRVVGWGQKSRSRVKLDYEFLITVTIPEAVPLREFIQKHASDSKLRRRIIRQLAKNTRTIHAHHFFHQDLKWRNLLVSLKSKEQFELYWIDCPRGYWDWSGLRRRHGRIKDLATLDKVAKDLCSLKERLFFIKHYLDVPSGDPAIRKFGRAVERYRKRRQDD